jgi:hypothetical protein
MDQVVLAAQQRVNATYSGLPGYQPVPATGRTGWVHGLRADAGP